MPESGYRRPPALVRRADGQVLQLTPTLYALAESIDGQRDADALAAALGDRLGMTVGTDEVEFLLEKLRPLGLLRGSDGTEPASAKANPLLALRCRFVISDEARTKRITAPFTPLFRPVVVAAVLVAFVASSTWLIADHGLAQAARHVLQEPALLLTVFALTIASAGFHELGHAAACRYGGATPGAMGAGLYLVFPAFYTDVSDSYRLDRRSRLRTDLGGLYFNAVFAVAAFAGWWVTGWEALLVIVPLQQLQMLKQLAPFVRLDGYHILADLTGVPDLFAQIRPVLRDLLPTRWGRRSTSHLKPWVRVVVVAWVLLVVPVLALVLVLMIVTFPRLVATVVESAGAQWHDLALRWREDDAARTVLSAISLVALVVPLFSVTYFLSRVGRRSVRRVWRATEGDPPLRFAVATALTGLLLIAGVSWWPNGQYEPISSEERGTVGDLGGAFASLTRAEPASASSPVDTEPQPAAPAQDPPLVVVEFDPASLPLPLPSVPHHDFVLPDAPGKGDNQALALNRTDGTVVNVSSGSLVWVFDGVVDHVNGAWAFTNCRDCGTNALAYQVILVVGSAEVVSPQNLAVAVNGSCASCVANAVARQLLLTLDVMPSAEELAALEAVWVRVEATLQTLGTVPIEETLAQLASLEAEIVEVLSPSLATTTTSTATTPTTVSPTTTAPAGDQGDPTTTTAASGGAPSTQPTTTSTPDSTSTTATP